MKKLLAALVALLVLGAGGFFVLTSPAVYHALRGGPLEPTAGRAADLARGELLFHAGGCASCHAVPDQGDQTRLGGGVALETDFGVFHAPNISPDQKDGIGAWSNADFIRATREGVTPNGVHLYPSFPYTSYRLMSPDDLSDLFAYLKTLPAVAGASKPHELPFPYNIRRGLGLWKLAFLSGNVFEPDTARTEGWNRGAYLVNGPGHCAECHSPRNLAGAIPADRRFAGGPDPEGNGTVPNITQDPSGIGGWTKEEIVTLLTTGETPNFDTVGGGMRDVVKNTAQLPEADRDAIAEYLLTLPARPSAGTSGG
jgi:mono/diheme cytochrome c family protein